MSNTQATNSTVKAVKGNETFYLTAQDEANGLDIKLDLQGYTIVPL